MRSQPVESSPAADPEAIAAVFHLKRAMAAEVGRQYESGVIASPAEQPAAGGDGGGGVLAEAAVVAVLGDLERRVHQISREQRVLRAGDELQDARSRRVAGRRLQPQGRVDDMTVLPQLHLAGRVHGRDTVLEDVLVDAAGHALFAGHLDPRDVSNAESRPNATELVFLDPHTRELYVDWREKALASVGHLRILASEYPSDARLLALIGLLTAFLPDVGEFRVAKVS